jgi:predicted metalloendopeptidase
LAEYRKRASCFVHEYSTLEDCKVDAYGEQTLCENVADNNGLRIAYEALFEDGPTRHLYTQEDRKEFLLANAQMWCASYSPQVLCESAKDDVHAVALLRVRKTFAQLPYYADVMQCAVGDPMHKHARERCSLFGPEA